jgi:uncharacterized protein (TIGR02391 family)
LEQFLSMRELRAAIPDVEVLLRLEPEELGAKLLFLLRSRPSVSRSGGKFHPAELLKELSTDRPKYPRERRDEILQAVTEAWAWLEGQALIVPAPGNAKTGWYVLSRRACRSEKERELVDYSAAQHLSRQSLHPRLNTVWQSFVRREYDNTVFQAMKSVEVAVRDVAGLLFKDIGVALMRKAFHAETGPLSDFSTEPSERQARSDLFAGAIGCFKNPHSHRDVMLEEPREAAEIVMFANHLLRIVDASAARVFTPLFFTLPPMEERIVRMRFGIGMEAKHSLEQVRYQFSITRQHFREIEAKALLTLKHASERPTMQSRSEVD